MTAACPGFFSITRKRRSPRLINRKQHPQRSLVPLNEVDYDLMCSVLDYGSCRTAGVTIHSIVPGLKVKSLNWILFLLMNIAEAANAAKPAATNPVNKIIYIVIALLARPVSAAQYADVVVPIHKKGAATFYIKGRLGNLEPADFMVDTGSGYLVINQQSLALLKRAGQAAYKKDIKGILANGQEFLVPVWRISSLTINDQCVLHDVDAAVFPGKTRQILGLTALKKAAPFTLSFDPPQLILSHCAQVS